ncbi:predicted protein [Histoplasma capsulatum G186AR]|uniref:Uncharacterized protein n=1 Tax=Ajellomyces capsulatus (strain G186AR / H82 / ATCC MYA-2454 / RMSCC 2432) TaxID=447093 RepID=C0NU48_AJECG|nr:uncharacterized protein HCBG_06879 [Histoplasma capsulatum G186AR]EEH04928.1 predicted protein [Histoplasma capsulatum G186AR]
MTSLAGTCARDRDGNEYALGREVDETVVRNALPLASNRNYMWRTTQLKKVANVLVLVEHARDRAAHIEELTAPTVSREGIFVESYQNAMEQQQPLSTGPEPRCTNPWNVKTTQIIVRSIQPLEKV